MVRINRKATTEESFYGMQDCRRGRRGSFAKNRIVSSPCTRTRRHDTEIVGL